MINPGRTAQRFLEGLNSESKSTFETLNLLIEELENKNDPDPVEMRLLDQIYIFVEKMKVLENNVRSYVNDSRKNQLLGSKLSSLYENSSYDGNAVFTD